MFIAWLGLLSLYSKYLIVAVTFTLKKCKGQVLIVFCSEP